MWSVVQNNVQNLLVVYNTWTKDKTQINEVQDVQKTYANVGGICLKLTIITVL